jgi:hypothetical protein
MNFKIYIYILTINLVITMLWYLVFNNLIMTAIFITPVVFLTLYLVIPIIKRVVVRFERQDQLGALISILLTQLRIDKSLALAFKNTLPYLPIDLQDNYQINPMSPKDYLDFLSPYFNSKHYLLFLNIIKLHDSKGGDINMRGQSIIDSLNFKKIITFELRNTIVRKLSEFTVMWILAFGVILYMRIGLSTYYLSLLDTNFIYAIIFIVVSFIVSTYLAITSLKKIEEITL